MMGFWLLSFGCNEQPESSGLVVIDAMMPTDAFNDFDSSLDDLGQDADAAQRVDARPQTPADMGVRRCPTAKPPWQPGMSACLLYTSPSPRDRTRSRMPSSA